MTIPIAAQAAVAFGDWPPCYCHMGPVPEPDYDCPRHFAQQRRFCYGLDGSYPCRREPGHPGSHSRVGCSEGC